MAAGRMWAVRWPERLGCLGERSGAAAAGQNWGGTLAGRGGRTLALLWRFAARLSLSLGMGGGALAAGWRTQ